MDRTEWNKLVCAYTPPFGAFLQSYEWGEFQKRLGRDVVRVYEEDETGVLIAQAVKLELPFGQYYWFVPKGPLGTMEGNHATEILRNALPGGVFLRLEPAQEMPLQSVKEVHPATSLILDLSKDEEVILQEMKSKTRYNVRLSRRKGVTSRRVDLSHFDDFTRLVDQTAARDKIRFHAPEYYRMMLETLHDGQVRAFLAMSFFEGRPLAADIIVDFAGQRTYLFGATSNLHRNVMAQYHLHAHLIFEAKERGMETFDFFGIAPPEASKKHSWFGITRYKLGWGGDMVQVPGTQELTMKHFWYGTYRTLKGLRGIFR
jgi:lipid II:glycine glycyltransferase (peptidoglycan interpeptide bridge formation enzyme)